MLTKVIGIHLFMYCIAIKELLLLFGKIVGEAYVRDVHEMTASNAFIGKKYLDLLEKSCDCAAETMEKSCRLPPIVYGIIDIGKVLETQRFYVVFPKTMKIRFKIGLKRKTHIPYASV